MEHYYSVQEFARLTNVEASTLRYWDSIGIFSPARRDPETNYRYYTLAQITAVNFVSILRDLHIPLKTIADLRKERNPENFLELLAKKEKDLDMELRALRERSSIIHERRELINRGLRVDDTQISVSHRESAAIILWPRNEYREGDTFLEPLAAFVSQAAAQRVNLSFPVGGYWDTLESLRKASFQPSRFFSIDPIGAHVWKKGEYLTGYARGDYGELGDLPERMAAYAKENHLSVSGPVYTVYLHDEVCTPDPSRYLAQSSVSVSRAKARSKR